MIEEMTDVMSPFKKDVLKGLKAKNKYLSSKYFYDKIGDDLFQQIMDLDEYYLTRKELEIFKEQNEDIRKTICNQQPFWLIELGAGDGRKTKVLLKHFLKQGVDFKYIPVDISENVLEILSRNLKKEIPNLNIEPYQGDYFDALSNISDGGRRNVVFFLGSNVGNFSRDVASQFLIKLSNYLNPKDLLFMGVDLKKDPSKILAAYNDSEGITSKFNLNLLDRINKELGGNFNTNTFLHYPYYNPQTGECRSYLISEVNQVVKIGDEEVHFDAWEAILMETSKKYDESELKNLANSTGFTMVKSFKNEQNGFADVLWEVR